MSSQHPSKEEVISPLFELTVAELTRRIKDGSATAAELSTAAKMLKDNGITVVGDKNPATQDLKLSLTEMPDFDEEDVAAA